MPDVLIEVRGDWLRDRKVNFIEAVQDAIVVALQTPKDGKILRLIEHSPEKFSIPGWAGGRFTHIEISVFTPVVKEMCQPSPVRGLFFEIAEHLDCKDVLNIRKSTRHVSLLISGG